MNKFSLALILALASCALGRAETSEGVKAGDAYDAQLKTKEALAAYLEAEKTQPKDLYVLTRISREYALSMDDVTSVEEKKKLGEQALEYAKRAVELDPKYANAQLSMAICYGRLAPLMDNKTKIAYSKLVKEYADKALALNPGESYCYHVLGAWNYELANLNPVMRALAKLIYGDIPSASNDDAVKYFKKAIEIAPERVGHHVELGRTYLAEGKKDLAKEELTKGLNLPNHEKDDPEEKSRAREALKKI